MRRKIKISLLEYDLSSFGGRHITFVDGFLDCFKEMGFDAKIYGIFTGKLLKSVDELLEKSLASHVTKNDIQINELATVYRYTLPEWEENDVILSVAHYEYLSRYVNTPVIHWIIAKPPDARAIKSRFIWTNSYTQKKEIGLPFAEVVYPPHDYSPFRKYAKPWQDREIDILMVTGVSKSKIGKIFLGDYLKAVEKLTDKFNIVGIFSVRTEKEMRFVENLSYQTHVNVSRKEIPKFMGNAKIFFHPSPLECAALAIYESLNSGCYPVVQRAGACAEQMGRVGLIYDDFNYLNRGFWDWLKNDIMDMNYNIQWSIKQGKKFDRKVIKPKIRRLIQRIVEGEWE